MKKKAKKLILSRESLRLLEEPSLIAAQGGATFNTQADGVCASKVPNAGGCSVA
jgi:hypothetical protein